MAWPDRIRNLFRQDELSRDLDEDDLDLLLDAVEWKRFERGERLYGAGDRADACFLVVDGLVQLQLEDDGRVHVSGYVSRGDFFGDEDALGPGKRSESAVALGDGHCLRVPKGALGTLSDRNPGLLPRLRRLTADREALQLSVVGGAVKNATQHVFKDLYRMQMARSLLAIDQDTCVRCGHCAWACADVHGVSRLVRRGDKIVARVETEVTAQSLLLPSSCQHCENPVCMIDCPTGAIGRDPRGEVFIRDDLCTGCGACAKACPWENISMAPRPGSEVPLAVKCDLCRKYEEPACVSACPTESILRLDPRRDFAEVRKLLGGTARATTRTAALPLIPVAGGIAAVIAAVGLSIPGLRLGAGIFAGVGCLALGAYALPKRLVKRRMKPRSRRSGGDAALPRSKTKQWLSLHVALGLLTMALVVAHAGSRFSATPAGALHLVFWLVALLGVFGAVAYRVLPSRLGRLERAGALPEDFRAERERLLDRFHRALTGKSELVKTLAERVLSPYARSGSGPIVLLSSGRSLSQEQRALRARVEAMLQGRGQEKLDGLDDLIRIVVELRALPLRRALTASLRVWLPLHIIASAVLLVLLLLHVLAMVRL